MRIIAGNLTGKQIDGEKLVEKLMKRSNKINFSSLFDNINIQILQRWF